jgi:transcriptional regulator with XRE-family HTH domain
VSALHKSDLGIVDPHPALVRRHRLKMTQEEIGKESGLNRDTVSAVEGGGGSAASQRRIDAALTRLESEAGLPPFGAEAPTTEREDDKPHVVRFEVQGVYGAKALIVEGPVEDLPALEAAVDRIMRRLAGEQKGADD